MKSYVSKTVMIMMMFAGQSAFSSKNINQTFDFKYVFAGEKLSVSQDAPDYYEAIKKAAKSCFTHFKSKTNSNHEKGVELIDVCANPKSS